MRLDTALWMLPVTCSVLVMLPVADPVRAADIRFDADVRPILAGACLHCHGPDEEGRAAELRLDERDGLFEDRGGYAVVVPGNADASELIRRITSTDPSVRMPPPDSNKSLNAAQTQTLIDWVRSGADWQQHWAFVPPERAEPPQPPEEFQNWPASDIDNFLLHAMHRGGLSPSEPAPAPVLLRRVFLDLIGLPPSPQEADLWSARIWPADSSTAGLAGSWNPDAWAALVDDLLNRPEYGERWARRWLDLARYADTNGYEKDRPRSIWPYRDWVVDSLNQDMPFDQFTMEQIAGDMLPDATDSQKIATGFHRNTMLNEEGGIDPLEFRFHAMTDRVGTTGTTWLGLTLGCAQCHTHKYDPISHHEYYQVMAFLNNCDEPTLELRGEGFDQARAGRRQQAAELIESLPGQWPVSKTEGELPPELVEQQRKEAFEIRFESWLEEQRQSAVPWTTAEPVTTRSNLALLQIEPDHSVFASGDTAKQDFYEITFAPAAVPITALRLEALPDERLPARGPGTTYYEGTIGDFFLTEFRVLTEGTQLAIHSATESYARNRFGNGPVSAALTIDGDIQTGWSVHEGQGQRHTAVFLLKEPIPPGQPVTIRMNFGRHFASSLGRFLISLTDATRQPVARRMTDSAERLLLKSDAELSAAERQELVHAFLLEAPEVAAQAEQIRTLLLPPDVDTTLVMSERPDTNPRPTFRHHRGEYLQPRDEVNPDVPGILHDLPDTAERNRLSFARWLVDRRNPLTARVVVNRHWSAFFGTGIVSTPEDFGLQGSPPSHPELLDWLAVTFMDDDHWSLKSLHRRIVFSAAYRQSAVVTERAAAIDPQNRLLSHAPRFRLDAEVIRDSALQAAGVLSLKKGGPPVRPPQPAGITEVAYGRPEWVVSKGEDRFRRSLYTEIKRTAPFAMTLTFDGLSGESCVARRNRSNSPLQALTLLNDVMFVDLVRTAGWSVAQDHATGELRSLPDREIVVQLFRRSLTRLPDDNEAERLLAFVSEVRGEFREDPEAAREFAGFPDGPPIDGPDAERLTAEAATWAAVLRSLLSLDEFVTRP